MEKRTIGIFEDKILGVNYELITTNAKSLSDELKSVLQSMGIDYNTFNSDSDSEANVSIFNPDTCVIK